MDSALPKFNDGVTQSPGNDGRVTPCHFQHFIGHIDADNFSCRADDLRRDETNLPCPAAQIEHGFSRLEVTARVAAAIILLNDFFRDDFQVLALIIDGATQRRYWRLGSSGVTLSDCRFGIGRFHGYAGHVCVKEVRA